ncbi:glycosyltransferase family 4 protein [Quadrisphaera sp. DSM 44207]|uniref:glycosyltransferase family 4 protein n=1 Tax=Quadrisphaera sp. DSM 44207 TaxID=1881057 RepID=UPI00089028B9|nr:glycosyltransferase family 4 protein [Quadrisphaera sp. DSM 44207]SDQ66923.1 Glycosyltransferase involved in cell wall bisynthesis [Quadrisphaera sp. DSM 44207]
MSPPDRGADAAPRGAGSAPELTVASLSTQCWGAEESLLTLLRHAPVRARVVAPEGELLERARSQGHEVLVLDDPVVLRLGEIGVGVGAPQVPPLLARAAARLARRPIWNGGTVVSFSMWLHPPLAAAGRLRRRPVALDLHDGPFSRAGAALQAQAAFLATRSVAVSRTALGHVRRWPQRRTTVVPRPVELPGDLPAPHRGPPGEDAPAAGLRAVLVGRLDPEKRVEVALEAQRRALAAGTRIDLDVVGAPLRGSGDLEDLRRAWPDARFHGRQQHGATLRLVAAADVLVSTATGEAFGRTVVEAALLGVPSVVMGGGPADLVADGRTGFLTRGDDAAALAERFLVLAGQRERVREVGASARTELGRLCDPGRVARRWTAAVAGAPAGAGGRAGEGSAQP